MSFSAELQESRLKTHLQQHKYRNESCTIQTFGTKLLRKLLRTGEIGYCSHNHSYITQQHPHFQQEKYQGKTK